MPKGSSACHLLFMWESEGLGLIIVFFAVVDVASIDQSFKGFLGPAGCASFLSCVQSALCTPLAWAHTFVLVLVLVGMFVIMR